jgi:hypothetical protein
MQELERDGVNEMSWEDILKEEERRKKVPYIKDGMPHCCQKPMEFVEGKDGDKHRCTVCGGEI